MTEIKVNKDNFVTAVKETKTILGFSRPTPKEEFQMLRIHAYDGNVMTIAGTSNVASMEETITCAVTGEADFLVEPALLADVASRLADETLNFVVDGNILKLQNTGFDGAFAIKTATDYSLLAEGDQEVHLDVSDLLEAMRQTAHAVGKDEGINLNKNAFYVEPMADGFSVSVTDSFRISSRGNYLEENVKNPNSFTLSGNLMKKVLPLIPLDGKILNGEKTVTFKNKEKKIIVTKNSGQFFDMRNLRVPQNVQTTLTINREYVLEQLGIASLLRSEEKAGRFTLKDGKCVLTVRSALSQMNFDLAGQLSSPDIDLVIGLNTQFLADALKSIDSDDVVLEISGKQTPVYIRQEGVEEIILPTRLREE